MLQQSLHGILIHTKVRGLLERTMTLKSSYMPRWLSGKESTCLAWEMSVRSLGREDSLEKEMATHSSILA